MSKSKDDIVIDTRIDQSGALLGLEEMKAIVLEEVASIVSSISDVNVVVLDLGSGLEQMNGQTTTLFNDTFVNIEQFQGKLLAVLSDTESFGILVSDAFNQIIPTTLALNVELEQVRVALGSISSVGMETASIVTALDSTLSKLSQTSIQDATSLDLVAKQSIYAGQSFQGLTKKGTELNGSLSVSSQSLQAVSNNLLNVGATSDSVSASYGRVGDAFNEKSGVVVKSLESIGVAAFEKFGVPLIKSMDDARASTELLANQMSDDKVKNGVSETAENILTWIERSVAFAANMSTILESTTITTEILSTATKGLAASMAATPFGWAAAGLGALAIGGIALASSLGSQQTEHEKVIEKLNEEAQAREELKAKQREQLEANLTEVDHIQSLNQELSYLVDSNGKVKAGYESRTSFILNELNGALGLNMELTNGEITGNEQLGGSIDSLIEKKRAEVILESQLPAYKEAILESTNAQIKANELNAEISKNNIEIMELEAEISSMVGENYTEVNQAKLNAKANELNSLKEETKIKESEYEAQGDIVDGYYQDISTYETNAALIASGNAENYKKVQADTAASRATSTEEKKLAMQDEMDAETAQLNWMKEDLAIETDEVRKKEKEAAIIAKEDSIKTKQEELNGFVEAINAHKGTYSKAYQEMTIESLESFKGDSEKYFGVSQEKIQNVIDGLKSKDGEAREKAKTIASEIFNNLDGKKDEFSTAGANAISGVLNGVDSKSGWLSTTMMNVADSMLFSFKKQLRIESPSKKFSELSKFIPEGIKKGIDDNKNLAIDSIAELSEDLADGFVEPELEVKPHIEGSLFGNYNLDKVIQSMQALILGEQMKMMAVVDAQTKVEIMRTSNIQNDANGNVLEDGGKAPSVIENHFYVDGRELANVLSPHISNEFAFNMKGRR